VVHDRDDTPFDQYGTAVDRGEAEARLEARVDRLDARMDRLEAGLGRLEAKMARLERTVRWWIMIQMVRGTAWIAVFLCLIGRTR
jgi:hypothetical protein